MTHINQPGRLPDSQDSSGEFCSLIASVLWDMGEDSQLVQDPPSSPGAPPQHSDGASRRAAILAAWSLPGHRPSILAGHAELTPAQPSFLLVTPSSPATPVHRADCLCEYCVFGSPVAPRAPATPPTEEATNTQLHAMIQRHQLPSLSPPRAPRAPAAATDSSPSSAQLDNTILSLSFRVPQSLRAWQPCIWPPMVWSESEPESEPQCDPEPAKKRRWKLQPQY